MSKPLEELKADALKKMAAYRSVFKSPEGQVVLADLKAMFDRSCTVKTRGGDVLPHSTVAMSGARDVILHIIDNIAIGEQHAELD